jgi:hypothetical protein
MSWDVGHARFTVFGSDAPVSDVGDIGDVA